LGLKRDTLKDKAYLLIKQRIIDCTYPPDSFLVESELMEQVGASRTPIREALNKLEQENLVRILPKRGVMVSGISLSALHELYEVRLLVEPYVIEHYGRRIPKEKLTAQLARTNASAALPTGVQFHAVDNDLHQMLLEAGGNVYLKGMMDNIYAENSRIRMFSGMRIEDRRTETLAEHTEILQKMLAEDFKGAAQAMRVHLENSKETALHALRAAGGR
jgi:DNA-binding GntR family transcriptional regulator